MRDDIRQWIIELIQNDYDPAPSFYKKGDNWDDGAGDIADQIIERFKKEPIKSSEVKIEEAREDVISRLEASMRSIEELINYKKEPPQS